MVFVHARHCLTHCVYPISKRKQRVQYPEKSRGHFNRIGSCRTRNLQNDQQNADCFAGMFKCNREGIYHIDIDKRCQNPRRKERRNILALNVEDQKIPRTDNGRLNKRKQHIRHPPTEICLACCQIFQPFVAVNFHLQDRY